MSVIIDFQLNEISSAYVNLPFDQGKVELEKAGYQIISLEQDARLRKQVGINSEIFKKRNWVKEGVLCLPKGGKFLTKNSPIMINSVEATKTHRGGNEFYLTDEQIEQGLIDSIKLKNGDFSIPTKRFGEDKLTVYAFGSFAQEYGDFLNETYNQQIYVQMSNKMKDKPFIRPLLFGGPNLFEFDRWLSYGYRVRGISEEALTFELNCLESLSTNVPIFYHQNDLRYKSRS
jgi:hypothetical protein